MRYDFKCEKCGNVMNAGIRPRICNRCGAGRRHIRKVESRTPAAT